MNEKQIRGREIAAFTLMGLLLLLSGIILYRMDYSRQLRKMQDQNQMKLDFVAEMIRYLDSIQDASKTSFENHQEKNLRFMTMTGADFPAADEDVQISFEIERDHSYLNDEDFQKMAKQTLDGVLILASSGDQQQSLIRDTASSSGTEASFEPELVSKLIKDRPQTVRTAGSQWLCTYSLLDNRSSVLLYLTPLRQLILRCLFHIGLAEVSALLIFVATIAYFFSVIKYSSSHPLTKQQIDQYQPKKLRRKLAMSGLTGALIIFVSTAVLQTMDALHEESIIGAQGISDLFAYVGNSVSDRITEEKQKEDQWYVDHGERIASLIAQDPEKGSREDLQEFCDLFDIDYIMLFDPKGKEIACSADYIGFTMDKGLGENSADFRRLLKGIPYIIHDFSFDPVTELERQFIGVRVPFRTGSGETEYGALLMAISPRVILTDVADIIGQFHFLDGEKRLYFYADQDTGEILYAGDRTMVGKTILDYGLPERSLQEGYTDFTTFNGVDSYVTMIKQQIALDFFYVIRSSVLFSNTLPMAFSVLLCYIITAQILGWFCLKDYKEETFEALTNGDNQQERNALEQLENTDPPDYSELLISKNRSDTRWTDKTPENQAGTILKIDMVLLVILPLLAFTKIYGDSSLLRFIMYGNWMRGVNLFSFCATVIILILGILAVVICNGILSMIAGFTGRGGETICRMLYSLIQYMAILNMLYYIFGYVGLSMSTYFASLGATSLALSIGAQGMVADILAGVLIVFERQFQVGDIVEINDFRGKVLEIGVRSTRFKCSGGNIRFINNSDIRSVLNKSIHNSTFRAEISLVTRKSLMEIEEFLNRELPLIGQKSDLILSGPAYEGLVKVIDGTSKLGNERTIIVRIIYVCTERDRYKVRDFIAREFYMLCEREEIGLR